MWYYEDSIANILSLYRVSNTLHVQYDSRVNNTFLVWKNHGTVRRFTPAPIGLYYCDTRHIERSILATVELDPDQIKTVKTNMVKYNQRQLKEAQIARYFQNTTGLSTRAILKFADSGAMRNSPITRESIRIAQDV